MLIILVPAGLDFVDQHHNLFFFGKASFMVFFWFPDSEKRSFPPKEVTKSPDLGFNAQGLNFAANVRYKKLVS